MQDNLPLSRVHDLSTEMEALIKQRQPQLFRVLIHTEPQTDNTR
jgi:divalent metal cation (Fe/Co/Zn/Cd) transporter